MSLSRVLQGRLEQRRVAHRYRQRQSLQSPQGVRVRVAGRELACFCSNDYLGLANHPRVVEAFKQAAVHYGVGSGASHLVCGHSDLHQQLEHELARLTGRARALLFSTGYMANLGVITALVGRGDHILQDRLNHASLLDGGLLSRAKLQRFHHNSIEDLARRLELCSSGNKMIAVDGVFSMDGDLAPLPKLAQLASRHDAWLMVDDAHGLGCLGAHGGGTVQAFGLNESEVPVLMGTLGKSFGSFGAFVAGSEELIEALIQFARPYIYTTALPPAVAAASLASLQLVRDGQQLRSRLTQLIAYFHRGLHQLGLPAPQSNTPIQPLILGDDQRALRWSKLLWSKGVWVSAIRPPTVPQNTARLRITLSAAHTEQDIDVLLDGLRHCLQQVG